MANPFSHIDTWIFDMDDTLYHPSTGLLEAAKHRVFDVVGDILKTDLEATKRLLTEYRDKHGFSFPGLKENPDFNMNEFIERVYNHTDPQDLQPCAETNKAIAQLPGRKVIWTNSPHVWAVHVLEALKMVGLFEQIFHIEYFDFYGKPYPASYQKIQEVLGSDPATTLLIDDTPANLKPAKALGWTTVLSHGKKLPEHDFIDYAYDDLLSFLNVATS